MIKEDFSIKGLNTFGIDVKTRYYANPRNIGELNRLREQGVFSDNPVLILGGGSNLLFTGNYEGIIVRPELKGIEIIPDTGDRVFVKASAGESWQDLIEFCLHNNLGGLENLSLIPGHVGAAPIQNIGAYGVEQQDVFLELEAMELSTGEIRHFNKESCEFGYRESIFKKRLKGKYIILNVTYSLLKSPHQYNIEYSALKNELGNLKREELSIRKISEAVSRIRRSKLPEPEEIGNAGSFFKNPVVDNEKYLQLEREHTGIVAYPLQDGTYKIAAGWLIDNAGWKGKRMGDAGVHNKQALVLVNYGHATGREIFELSERIRKDIHQKFRIDLEREVTVI